jgi:hypothetical protein
MLFQPRRIQCAAFIALAVAIAGSARADYPTISATESVLSGFHDTTNFWSSETTYGFNLYNGPSDPNLFINQINFVYTSGVTPNTGVYNPAIGLTPHVGSTYDTGFGSYTLGTPLAPNTLMYLYDAVTRSGDVANSVANGTYDFSINVLGGYDSSATDTLATIGYQILIANGIHVSASASASPGTISAGQNSDITMTVTNSDATQTFVTTTWFVSSFTDGTNELPFVGFAGDWFDKMIGPGGSRTDLQSTRTADITTPPGTYNGTVGVVGGLVDGDNFYVLADPGPTIEVVTPEPASLAVLVLGSVGLMVRRKRGAGA